MTRKDKKDNLPSAGEKSYQTKFIKKGKVLSALGTETRKAKHTKKQQFFHHVKSMSRKKKKDTLRKSFLKKEKRYRIVRHQKESPVVGILTIPNTIGKYKHTHSYLPQSYIKWIEASSARVVPIQYDLPPPIIQTILGQCNGILFVGGQVDSGMISREYADFMATVKLIFNYVRGENLRGNHYPIFAICLGFELLAMLKKNPNMNRIEKNYNKFIGISQVAGRHYAAQNIFVNNETRLAKIFTKKEREYQANNPICVENHGLGFFPDAPYMTEYRKLWNIASVAPENKPPKEARQYINMIEFKDFPFFGSQFHPEKAIYEWLDPHIIHTPEAREFSLKIGDFFIEHCRKNNNILYTKSLLIYNYTLHSRSAALKVLNPNTFIMKKNKSVFETVYYFNIITRDN